MTRIPHRPLALAIACALLGAAGAAQAQQVIKLTAAAASSPPPQATPRSSCG